MGSTSRRAVGSGAARGWCPRHDHVYAFRDGVCPDCGTSLVAVDLVPPPEEHEIVATPPVELPTVRSPRAVRGMVAGLILAAFIVGWFFASGDGPAPDTTPQSTVTQNVRVGAVARAPAGTLLLSRLIQRGRTFSAQVSTSAGSLDPRAISGVAVEVETEHSSDLRTVFGVSDVRLTHELGGFSLDGTLPTGSGKIVQFRITSLQLRAQQTPLWNVDISSIWPTRGAEPKVMRVGTSRSVGSGRSLRLVALLAWHDRLEVDLGLPEVTAGAMADVSIDGLEMTMSGEGDGLQDRWRTTLGAVQLEQISPTEILARFEGIPSSVGQITIRAARVSRFLVGPWSWRIA